MDMDNRIEDLIKRLQALQAAGRAQTLIDIDLMLDYIRVLYADLLEKRRDLVPVLSDMDPVPGFVDREDEEPELMPEGGLAKPLAQDPPLIVPEPLGDNGGEGPMLPMNREGQEGLLTDDRSRPVEMQQGIDTSGHSSSMEEPLSRSYNAISFEPPRPKVYHEKLESSPISEELPEQEKEGPSSHKQGPEARTPKVEETDPVMELRPQAPPLEHWQPKAGAPYKDIRKSIGINDKYLFLNELFSNKKDAYEDAMDALNSMTGVIEGVQYRDELAEKYKWDLQDGTVINFYALLDKYFSDK